jgi:hypothetical protein
MRLLFIIFSAMLFTGCASVPHEDLNLDTTSNFNSPSEGRAGIYVYQWKTGILGAGSDVDFEIKGYSVLSLNTGEYGYFEMPPGDYEYKLSGGLFDQFVPVKLEANENYFFRAFLLNFSDNSVLIRDQTEIDETKENISSARYELYSID